MKLLVLLPRFPYPLDKGDKLRAFYQIQYLSQFHDIYLVHFGNKPNNEQLEAVSPFCKQITTIETPLHQTIFGLLRSFFRGEPFQNGCFYVHNGKKIINTLIKKVKPEAIYCQMVRVASWVKDAPIKKILDFQDVLSVGYLRRMEKASILLKPFFYCEYKRLQRYEAKMAQKFDHTTIITEVDRDLLSFNEKDKVVVVPNGININDLSADNTKKYDLIFTGNMSYPPNVDAAIYLVNHILPLVRSHYPNIKIALVGTTPAKAVRQLASENVEVTGQVPSIIPYYYATKIFIAPMRLGTGLQNKILEAMSCAIPCIVSSLAGNSLKNAKNGEHLWLADTEQEFAAAILSLLEDKNRSEKMAIEGYNYVKSNYNWNENNEILHQIILK